MPLFKVEFINEEGKKEIKNIEALNIASLKSSLSLNHCYYINSSVVKEKKKNTFFAVSSKVKPIEVILFLRQFSVMINSGATISESLDALKREKHSAVFTNVLCEVHDDVLSGVLLSQAFKKHPKVFPDYFTSMIAIGEVSGSLDRVLVSLAEYYENDRKVKTKAKNALIYPIFLTVMIFAVVMFMALYIIPQYKSMLDQLGGNLPWITQVVVNISDFITNNILIIILAVAALVLIFYIYFRTKTGKVTKDWLKLHVPFIGKIQKELTTTRFSKAFVILLDSGMNITDCMYNLRRMLGNELLKKKFDSVINDVQRGVFLSTALDKLKFFPDILINMINVGERSGNLTTVLRSTSSYFDERVDSAITRATTALEPIMIIILGLVVGVVILAVFLPMISIYDLI